MLPLHYALRNGASEASVKAVLDAYPDAVKATDAVSAWRACAHGRADLVSAGRTCEGRWPSSRSRCAAACRVQRAREMWWGREDEQCRAVHVG